ncbi:type II secretion system protein [Porticoccus sp. GXU_MW_L64]
MKTIKRHEGFTLTELIVVIVLLGILAAIAVPRFINLSSSANAAVIENLAGTLRSAATLQHSLALVNASNGGLQNGFVSADGIFFDQGYPIGVSFGDSDNIPEILEALDSDLSGLTFNTIFAGTGSTGGPTRELYVTSADVLANGASAAQIIATNCYVSFESYIVEATPPEIVTVTSGC